MTQFDLKSFMTRYRDYARAYLFKCKIDNFGVADHEYLVKSTKLPESNIKEIETDWQGNMYKIGANAEVGDFSITFNMDDRGNLRDEFVKWTLDIHDPEKNTHGAPTQGSGYFRDIKLKHLNGQGNPILVYSLIDAWPKSVGEVALGYDTKEIASFDVSFAYQYHTMEKIAAEAAGTQTQIHI